MRAKLRLIVKRILRRYGYPPDKQEKATRTVLEQAEVLSANWGVEPPSDEAVALGDAPAYATPDERLTELPAVAERADLREPPGL